MTETRHTQNGSGGYEKKDVNVPLIVLWAAIIVLAIVFSLIKVDQYVTYIGEAATYENLLKPENPILVELRAHESAGLSASRKIDSVKRVYQIPIERAMELVIGQYKTDKITPVSSNPTMSGKSK